jgi:predicted nucleic acid-binding protein
MRSEQDTVVDASFIVPIMAEAMGPVSRTAIARETVRTSAGLVAPAILLFELLNSIRNGMRAGVLTAAQSQVALAGMFDLGIHLEPAPDLSAAIRISELAAAHGLTAYDASYLELAIRTKSPLATFDGALMRAAQSEGVPILSQGVN